MIPKKSTAQVHEFIIRICFNFPRNDELLAYLQFVVHVKHVLFFVQKGTIVREGGLKICRNAIFTFNDQKDTLILKYIEL